MVCVEGFAMAGCLQVKKRLPLGTLFSQSFLLKLVFV